MALIATVLLPASPDAPLSVLLAEEPVEGTETEGEEGTEGTGAEGAEEEATPPNPILPVGKEIAWGFGSFLVLLALVRYLLFPAVKRGMDARNARIQDDFATAERVTADAQAEVADYEAQLATIRAEGQQRVDAARAQLDGERSERLGAVSMRITERRSRAADEVDVARRAALGQVTDAVAEVAGAASSRVLGRTPDAALVRRIADEVVTSSNGAGVAR